MATQYPIPQSPSYVSYASNFMEALSPLVMQIEAGRQREHEWQLKKLDSEAARQEGYYRQRILDNQMVLDQMKIEKAARDVEWQQYIEFQKLQMDTAAKSQAAQAGQMALEASQLELQEKQAEHAATPLLGRIQAEAVDNPIKAALEMDAFLQGPGMTNVSAAWMANALAQQKSLLSALVVPNPEMPGTYISVQEARQKAKVAPSADKAAMWIRAMSQVDNSIDSEPGIQQRLVRNDLATAAAGKYESLKQSGLDWSSLQSNYHAIRMKEQELNQEMGRPVADRDQALINSIKGEIKAQYDSLTARAPFQTEVKDGFPADPSALTTTFGPQVDSLRKALEARRPLATTPEAQQRLDTSLALVGTMGPKLVEAQAAAIKVDHIIADAEKSGTPVDHTAILAGIQDIVKPGGMDLPEVLSQYNLAATAVGQKAVELPNLMPKSLGPKIQKYAYGAIADAGIMKTLEGARWVGDSQAQQAIVTANELAKPSQWVPSIQPAMKIINYRLDQGRAMGDVGGIAEGIQREQRTPAGGLATVSRGLGVGMRQVAGYIGGWFTGSQRTEYTQTRDKMKSAMDAYLGSYDETTKSQALQEWKNLAPRMANLLDKETLEYTDLDPAEYPRLVRRIRNLPGMLPQDYAVEVQRIKAIFPNFIPPSLGLTPGVNSATVPEQNMSIAGAAAVTPVSSIAASPGVKQ